MMDDESGESMEMMEKVPLKKMGDAELESLKRDVSAHKNAITRQTWWELSTWGRRVWYTFYTSVGVKQTGGRNMADIQHIKCKKNERKTSPNRRNLALCKEIGGGKSNDNVRNFTACS